MPPDLDIYVLSRARNRATIERFLDEYIDRATSQDREDEELMMLPLGATEEPAGSNSWDWEPANDLNHIVQRGLDEPHRAFSVYLRTLDQSLTDATLAFTSDGLVILGLSVDDEGTILENDTRAQFLLHRLATEYEGVRGWIGIELFPPLISGRKPEGIVQCEWQADRASGA